MLHKFFTLTLLFILIISCKKESVPSETEFFEIQGENGFVGAVSGTDAYVSILLGEEEGIAYVCNGEENISEWFSGTIDDLFNISLTNADGATLTAKFKDNSFLGTLTLKDGTSFNFEAKVNDNIYGGIYRVMGEEAEAAEIKAGWIVQTEDNQRGFFTFRTVVQPTLSLSKSKLKDIHDGTSNTLAMANKQVKVYSYKVKTPAPPAPFAPVPYPNTGTSNTNK